MIAFDWTAGGDGSDSSFRGKSRRYIVRAGEYTGTLKANGQTDAVVAFHLTQDPISGAESPALGVTSAGMGGLCVTGDTTPARTHEGADASAAGTGRGTPIVTTYSVPAIGHIREDDVASCITANTGGGGETQNPAFVVVASGQVSNVTNPTFDGAPSLTCLHEAPIVVGTLDAHDAVKWGSHQWVDQGKAMLTGGRPRRLTPLECERLMAWPDMHTAVGIDEQGREYRLSDTARYRLCGNGVGSTCTEWIGRRLMALEAMAQASERQGAA